MQGLNNDVGVGGLYVNGRTCWHSKAESFSAWELLTHHPEHEEIVRTLSTSLLDTIIMGDFLFVDPQWARRYTYIARLLVSPDYPGARYITDEVRSGLLVYLASHG